MGEQGTLSGGVPDIGDDRWRLLENSCKEGFFAISGERHPAPPWFSGRSATRNSYPPGADFNRFWISASGV